MKKMKLTAIVLATVFPLGVTGAAGAPRLEIPESIFDFGYVPQNAVISHVFWLKSTGDDTLRILNIKPG